MQQVSKPPARWPWLAVAVVVGAAGWWLLRPATPGQQAPATAETATPEGVLPPPAAAGSDAPGIQHPLEPLPEAADEAIPALADSDAFVFGELEALAGDPSVLGLLIREHLVQRLVVMVDNLTEPRVQTSVLALRSPAGQYEVVEGEGAAVADLQANTARYAPYVAAFTGADPQRLANTYRRLYPLFQQAYAEIGGPDAYFNDRLVQVIDHLLQAPPPPPAAALVRDERGRWRYVDPALESASVGHKALMRLSAEQQAAVKQQLRALRRALARP
ncbi:DUF3014 domain-containing protein [Pseudoxanthomonas suwonensis]|jgi:Protein of unknown function (DUF3014).|uniref:DUF3014 domain-containing protein n=1 Tax=Pseudoxanthomonas suwonensis TaxID=314722 RepID=UPI0004670FD6|nr:DUF3014 domain-containing protein [Pseudoxanthomonas suwonensis]